MVSRKKIHKCNNKKTKRNKKIKGGEPTYNDNILGNFMKAIEVNEAETVNYIINTYPNIVNARYKIIDHVYDEEEIIEEHISYTTPIYVAITAYLESDDHDIEIIETLFENGATNITEDTNLLLTITSYQIVSKSYKPHLDLIKLLHRFFQSKNIDFTNLTEKSDRNHYRAIHYAIYIMSVNYHDDMHIDFPDKYAVEYLKLFIELFKPNFNIKNYDGQTPLHTICNYTRYSIFHEIYNMVEPDPNQPDYDELLDKYKKYIRERQKIAMDIFKIVLDNTKNVNIRDNLGYTPFQFISALTIQGIKDNIIEQLREKGSYPINTDDIRKIYEILNIKNDAKERPIFGITTEIDMQEEIFDFNTLEEQSVNSIINASNDNIIFKYGVSTIFCSYEQLLNALNNLSNILYECKYPNSTINIYEYPRGKKHLFFNMRSIGLTNQIIPVGQLMSLLENIQRRKNNGEKINNQIFVLQTIETIDTAVVSVNVIKGGSWVSSSHCQEPITVNKCEINYVINNNAANDSYLVFNDHLHSNTDVNSLNLLEGYTPEEIANLRNEHASIIQNSTSSLARNASIIARPSSPVSIASAISAETTSTMIDDETMNINDDDETMIDDDGSVHELNDDSMDFSFGGKKKPKKNTKKLKGGEPTYNKEVLGFFLKLIDSNDIRTVNQIIDRHPDIINAKKSTSGGKVQNTPFITAIRAYFKSGQIDFVDDVSELSDNEISGGDVDKHYSTDMIKMLLYRQDNNNKHIGVNIDSTDNQDFLYLIVKFLHLKKTYKYNLDLIKLLYQYSQDFKNIDFTKFNMGYETEMKSYKDLLHLPLIYYRPVALAIYIMSFPNDNYNRYTGFPDEYAVEYLKILINMFKPKFDEHYVVGIHIDKYKVIKNYPLHLICNYTNYGIFREVYNIPAPHPENPNYDDLIVQYNKEIQERKERAMNIFKLILDNTTNVNLEDDRDFTPIQYISALPIPDIKDSIINKLIEKGSEPIDVGSIYNVYDILGIECLIGLTSKVIKGITTEIDLQEKIYDLIDGEDKTINSIINESNHNIIFKHETSSTFCNYEQLVNALNNLSNIMYECKSPGRIAVYEYDIKRNDKRILFFNMRAIGFTNQIVPVEQLLTLLRDIEFEIEYNKKINKNNRIFVLQTAEKIDSALVSVNVLEGGSMVSANHCQDLVSVDKCNIKSVITNNDEKIDSTLGSDNIDIQDDIEYSIVRYPSNSTRKRNREEAQIGGEKINKTIRKTKKNKKTIKKRKKNTKKLKKTKKMKRKL